MFTDNNDEQMSEKSITFKRYVFGKTPSESKYEWVNVPSIQNGILLSQEDIEKAVSLNKIFPTSSHSTQKEALAEAQARSDNMGDLLEEDNIFQYPWSKSGGRFPTSGSY